MRQQSDEGNSGYQTSEGGSRVLVISNSADVTTRLLTQLGSDAQVYSVAWDAEAVLRASTAWRPHVVFIDTSLVDGYLAYLLARSQSAGLSPTFIGIEPPDTWHMYQIGQQIRFVLPHVAQQDILRRLEFQLLPREIQ